MWVRPWLMECAERETQISVGTTMVNGVCRKGRLKSVWVRPWLMECAERENQISVGTTMVNGVCRKGDSNQCGYDHG